MSETGLSYNYLRDYDPVVGSYVESDPLGLIAGVNTYSYVRARPIMYSDKFGLADQGIDCAKLGYPTNPDRCIDQDQCFKKAQDTAWKCNLLIWSPARKLACIKCNETYAAGCIDKQPAPECNGTACASGQTGGGKS